MLSLRKKLVIVAGYCVPVNRRGRVGEALPALVALLLLIVFVVLVAPTTGRAAPAEAECSVNSGREFQRADPASVGLDGAALDSAIAFAVGRNRATVQVFRHNCLVATAPNNEQYANVAWNLWSVAKSVVSMATGIAYGDGRIGLDDPIGDYLAPGLGDARHRALTVRELLTETSGLRSATASEGVTGITQVDPDVVRQALATPFTYAPGTTYEYNQRAVDLLAYVVEQAVGQSFQDFVQSRLFDPLGIARTDYYWAKDRSGNTYGYSYLFMPPNDLSKLGLLMSARGSWNGRQVISSDYVRQAVSPSPTFACYGFLIPVNSTDCADGISGAPIGTFSFAGFGLQNSFVLPELDMVVTWTGVFGNISDYGPSGVLRNQSELTYMFFQKLLGSVRDSPVTIPGPYREPPIPPPNPNDFTDLDITLGVFGIGPAAYPDCTVFSCTGESLVPPLSGLPPGCVIVGCFGDDPLTPGIRAG